MLNVYDYFRKMQDESIVLYFKGEITNNLLTSILQLIDDRLERRSEDLKIKRKVFSILLECLQNVYNYQQQHSFPKEANDHLQAATLIIKRTEDAYFIITGNYMINDRVNTLKTKIDKVNSLTSEELKLYYKEVINTQGQSDTGGAGLGIIDIARKSGDKIEYSFDEINEKYCFYSLQVKIST